MNLLVALKSQDAEWTTQDPDTVTSKNVYWRLNLKKKHPNLFDDDTYQLFVFGWLNSLKYQTNHAP